MLYSFLFLLNLLLFGPYDILDELLLAIELILGEALVVRAPSDGVEYAFLAHEDFKHLLTHFLFLLHFQD